ncbi:MAG: tyrosine--tRNA ligase [Acidobacteriota bacterium]
MSTPTSLLDELQWRGLVYDASEGLREHLEAGPVTLYIGFDPTADSLHVGSLLQLMQLARLQRAGHRPIGLVGGGTGMIGDPSGKSLERQLLTREQVQKNIQGLRAQVARFLDFDAESNPALLLDNAEWLEPVSILEFLRDVGKHFTVNYMVAKESVKRRMESDEGISYTEFSYLLLQAYDFLVLRDRYGCSLQMGASDQWGNITAGTELIRKLRRTKAYGLVSPLVTTSSGVKFGKTEAGAVWLDPRRTSPYRFYQFWLNTSDDDVVRYLKFFTWLGREEIDELAARHAEAPQQRQAQRRLAAEVTAMVHGDEALERAQVSSEVLFGGGALGELAADELLEIFDAVPSSELAHARIDEGLTAIDLFADAGLAKSKGEARRLVRDGGAYVNNERVAGEQEAIGVDRFIDGRVLVLRKGRKKYHLVHLEGA